MHTYSFVQQLHKSTQNIIVFFSDSMTCALQSLYYYIVLLTRHNPSPESGLQSRNLAIEH